MNLSPSSGALFQCPAVSRTCRRPKLLSATLTAVGRWKVWEVISLLPMFMGCRTSEERLHPMSSQQLSRSILVDLSQMTRKGSVSLPATKRRIDVVTRHRSYIFSTMYYVALLSLLGLVLLSGEQGGADAARLHRRGSDNRMRKVLASSQSRPATSLSLPKRTIRSTER